MKRTRSLGALALRGHRRGRSGRLLDLGPRRAAATPSLTFMTFETPALDGGLLGHLDRRRPRRAARRHGQQDRQPGRRPQRLRQAAAGERAVPRRARRRSTRRTSSRPDLLEPFDQAWLDENFLLPNGNAIDGKTYIPPTNSQVIPLVFYNKDDLRRPTASRCPTTWAEFVDVGQDAQGRRRHADRAGRRRAVGGAACRSSASPAPTCSARTRSGSRSATPARSSSPTRCSPTRCRRRST